MSNPINYNNRSYDPSDVSDIDNDESVEYLNPNCYRGSNHRDPFNSNNSSVSNFQPPPRPTHIRDGRGSSASIDRQSYEPDEFLDSPHEIFNTSHVAPPTFVALPERNDPFDEQYEMNQYPQRAPNRTALSGLSTFRPGFLPRRRNDEEDERRYEQHIQYQFKGDSYNLATFEVRESPDAAHSPPPSFSFGDGNDYGDPFNREYEGYKDKEEAREKKAKFTSVFTPGVNGHLVLDCPVATALLSKYPDYKANESHGGLSNEFYFMRYAAVTCGPSNFYREGFLLRSAHYLHPRQTELMVVITMYNEDDILLARTLKGVFDNIKYLESKKSDMWGKDSWQKIMVCVISDGRTKINPRSQALLAALGVYQDGLAKGKVNNKDVRAHLYEYTTKVGIASVEDTVKLTTDKVVPVQLMLCLKEKNAKKINSHRWCFQALAQVLNPTIVVLLDAGTAPTKKSLYHVWKEFDQDSRVAGACGEIKASLRPIQMITNPMVYAQNFEYKMSNILDKPTESAFGFISVLPGAFSAYRYVALQNDINGHGPLEKYFKGEFLHASGDLDPEDDEYELKRSQMKGEAGIFTSNMYLAEDRILCYELVAKPNCGWLLRYCKNASAETDVPESLAEFILQRRRWLNGSFFAAIYALVKFPKVWKSSHSLSRKIILHIEFFYQFLNLVVSWFAVGSYFLVFRILSTALADPELNFKPGKAFSFIFLWLYLASIVTTFVLSFGNKPQGTEKFYVVIVYFFAVLMGYMIFASIYLAAHAIDQIRKSENGITFILIFKNSSFRDLVVATCSTYLLYFFASFIYFEPYHMFTSFIQYLLLSPSYINVLNIYAFCNIDDISWGTKGDTGAKTLGEAKSNEEGKFDVAIPVHEAALNETYIAELNKIRDPLPPQEKNHKIANEDYYAFVRSMTVLVWMFTNAIIVSAVLNTGGFDYFSSPTSKKSRTKAFLTVILWLVAFMALFRFIGCISYLVGRGSRRIKYKKIKKAKLPKLGK
ncbi:chitin synthase family protein [Scheffersomyces xylosifermentans]|uniref:chitin synthase family protein n=1 Tax=Scheffersomyces xylosifermentans TaxID=1304137 RepID=UPI00315CF23F